ncbi:alpha-1,6-mannosyl-glycoprotein 4-beta-N-acetylglucosaminyltransferase-like [Spea bombifrons]|uniref:alpha-1,6-mannosyl-glycoprotein 4-beta-N-acetylglucosaminyltransferase-like n=1 Tax=Spea bombifrons TaxID=233779 RepID=UPI00234A0D5E|nr:alpha-1,6-mannosyl-glycoprotein 4-beta-N-acetylglucosaminyltransferase-like [Spea bombifrons]XP_053305106.1 alpha-1,6-mannosyl-glycoprotein 4-beta-N-acetylglucosaminyltransferase-like [Spea bombifrons]
MRRPGLWKLLFGGFFIFWLIINFNQNPKKCGCDRNRSLDLPVLQILQRSARLFDVESEALGALGVPYIRLLGSPPADRRFLTVGISSVRRKKGDYLENTIRSLLGRSSPEELQQLLIVIFLANADHVLNLETAERLADQFQSAIDAGRIVVISSPREAYPTLEGLKRNYNDSPERVKFRSKQNIDYAFLVNYCANLSEYYIMLEDDVTCASNFLSSIKAFVASQSTPWTTVTFSNLGYIGKLYHSADLPKLARFLLLFYDEMPCDWLLDHFLRSKAQSHIIRVKPSLFQHVGRFSSFQADWNNLKDVDFVESVKKYGDEPPATCLTSMQAYLLNDAGNVCNSGRGFFWGQNIKSNDSFTMIFHEPVNIKKIHVITGSPDHPGDILKVGHLELGRQQTQDKKSCKFFTKIGDFHHGELSVSMDDVSGEAIGCLRILASASQTEWVIIQKVGIWLSKD